MKTRPKIITRTAAIACLFASLVIARAADARRDTAAILPDLAIAAVTDHPLDTMIRRFLEDQPATPHFTPTGLSSSEYLRIINSQVLGMIKYQDERGAIIDPVQKIEWQYSTPCYALSVAVLHASGYNKDPKLLESGTKAMDVSVNAMNTYKCAHNHGEFYLQPVMLALDLFARALPVEKINEWRQKIASIDPYKLHPDNLRRKKSVYNHNVVALAGEWLREKEKLAVAGDFFERHLAAHPLFFTDLGMYKDNPGLPIIYDEFSRQYLATILCEGYTGPLAAFYKDRLWKGAWMSLFMQSPFGECPVGGRSAQHNWNEAQMTVTYEIYAAQYARIKDSSRTKAIAGGFKRAAHLSLRSIANWLRPDGSGYVVKNRFPIEAKHGYESYSAQTQYNLLTCWLLAVAWLYSDDTIPEQPAPADTGGYVIPIIPAFHKIFANAAGNYVEYETAGDLRFNPTGLIRIHLSNSNPQLGPSDGVVHAFDRTRRPWVDLGGENLTVGPAWRDAAGNWRRLADYSPVDPPAVEIIKQTAAEVCFAVTYTGDFDGAERIRQKITINKNGVTVEDTVTGPAIKDFRIYYPALAFDGLEKSNITTDGNSVRISFRGKPIRCTILSPAGAVLQRENRLLDFRNGQVEPVHADIPGTTAIYQIHE